MKSEIARRLHEKITESGLSYGDLAKLSGIPKSTLQRYATGKPKKYSTDIIVKIADALHVSAEYILGWKVYNSTVILSEPLSEVEIMLINNYRKLEPGEKDFVYRYVISKIQLYEMEQKLKGGE